MGVQPYPAIQCNLSSLDTIIFIVFQLFSDDGFCIHYYGRGFDHCFVSFLFGSPPQPVYLYLS